MSSAGLAGSTLPIWVEEAIEKGRRRLCAASAESRPRKVTEARLEDISDATTALMEKARRGEGPFSVVNDVQHYFVSLFGERNARIYQRVLGIGTERQTQTAVAHDAGITRQRVSQIVQRCDEVCSSWRPPLLFLYLTEAALQQCGAVISRDEWFHTLPEWARPTSREAFRGLTSLIDLGWIDGALPSSIEGVWVSGAGSEEANFRELEEKLDRVSASVRRHIRRQGAIPLERLEELAGEDGVGLALSILRSKAPVTKVGSWWVPEGPHESVLLRRAKRIFAVCDTVPLTRVRVQLKRDMKSVPPRYILAEILGRELNAQIDRTGAVTVQSDGPSLENALSPGEAAAVEILREAGGALPHREFLRRMVDRGFSAALGVVLASRSVVLDRPGRNLVGVVGVTLTEPRRRELQRRQSEETRVFLGWRNVRRHVVELRYAIEADLLSTTVFHVPTGLLPAGIWTVAEDNRSVRVEETYVAGIHESISLAQLGKKGIVGLEFDQNRREITVSIRGTK